MKKGQGFVRRVTIETLEKFASLLRHRTQGDAIEPASEVPPAEASKEEHDPDPNLVLEETLFSGTPIKLSLTHRVLRSEGVKKKPISGRKAKQERATQYSMPEIIQGQLVWEKKKLPASDVQRQQGAPTGGLRLTQAKFEVKGKTINQTTYFRNDLFGNLNWTVGIHNPKKRQTVLASFVVKILGKDYGLWELVISHKPSGEAGQGNYTTMLHWGGLGGTIKSLNLLGKTFRLYAPPEGEEEPFFIEII